LGVGVAAGSTGFGVSVGGEVVVASVVDRSVAVGSPPAGPTDSEGFSVVGVSDGTGVGEGSVWGSPVSGEGVKVAVITTTTGSGVCVAVTTTTAGVASVPPHAATNNRSRNTIKGTARAVLQVRPVWGKG
jgi:hypothetical protein